MESLNHLLLVYAAYVLGAASPGPSNMMIMSAAMSTGRKSAMMLALGVVTGSVCWAMLAATGISAILSTFAAALLVLKIAGGLYLLYLAYKSSRSALRPAARQAKEDDRTRPGNLVLYRQGLLLHISNPKAILSWLAIMSLGLQPHAPAYTLLAVIVGCAVLGLFIFCGYALVFSAPVMVQGYRRIQRWIEGAFAAFFSFAGLRLLLSRG